MDALLSNFVKKHEELLAVVDPTNVTLYFDTLEKIDDLSRCLKNDFYDLCEEEIGHAFLKEYKRLIEIAQECVVNGFHFKLEKGKMILFGPENYASIHELIPAKNLALSIMDSDLSESQQKLATLFVSESNALYLINFAIALTQDSF